ncbi:collagen alpha-3(VI) chain-like isoform X2 [Liolophura sinensis]|uniref:collagen alpha-3(VI) chain-like isoform X2 n=1 Tax=Liolophura sinensis TaxID=3198878 RepID=UPI0031598DBF
MANNVIWLLMPMLFMWAKGNIFNDYIRQAYRDEARIEDNIIPRTNLNELSSLLTKGCGGIDADIVFVLDNSASIWAPDFKKQTAFVRDFVSVFNIGPKSVRVAVITFGDRVYSRHSFLLWKYKNEKDVKSAVMDIPYMAGVQTRTDKALEYLKKVVFRKMRKGVEHIVIVMTDGDSLYPMRTHRSARYLKHIGVTLYAIGVGFSVSLKELKSIASSAEGIFRVDNFDALQNIKKQLGVQICPASSGNEFDELPKVTTVKQKVTTTTTTRRPTTTIPTTVPTTPVPTIPPCGLADPADINFVCDAVQMDAATNRDVKEIVKGLVMTEEMQHEGMQVALITSECPELPSVPFSEYQSDNVTKFPEVFDDVHYQTYGDLIEILENDGFSESRGGRESARHVGVVILSQEPDDAEDVIIKADKAKRSGVELFAVGLNKKVRRMVLEQIASEPKRDHVIMIGSRGEVAEVGPRIAKTLCPRARLEFLN